MTIKKMIRSFFAIMIVLSLAISSYTFAEGIQFANQDEPNTVKSDETLVVALASEPSSLWMGGTGKLKMKSA